MSENLESHEVPSESILDQYWKWTSKEYVPTDKATLAVFEIIWMYSDIKGYSSTWDDTYEEDQIELMENLKMKLEKIYGKQ